MRKYSPVILILVVSLLANASYSQTGWTTQTNPLGTGDQAMLGRVQFVSATEGWISANGGRFLHTTDAGNNWVVVDPFPSDTVWNFSDPSLDMCWVNQNYGWRVNILGSDYSSSNGALVYKTTNGGLDWTKKNILNKPFVIPAQIEFVDQNYGWIILYDLDSMKRHILNSKDGGNTWNTVDSMAIEGAWVDFVDYENGWLITTSPNPPYYIQKTSDGGANWITQFTFDGNSQDSSGFNFIFFADINNGWVVGDNGKILHTTNGGEQWNFVTNSGVNINNNCKTVFFLDSNTGWIPSKTDMNEPYICHTTNGGQTWDTQETPLADTSGNNSVFSINFWDLNNGWLTADYGRIAHYEGVSSVQTEGVSINKFRVDQNYPNPFNPSTTIKFSIPTSDFVTLKVYDILGNEVATLVNEYKPAGNFEVEFDSHSIGGRDLSNGIYFYKFQAGSFVETKKMSLLK